MWFLLSQRDCHSPYYASSEVHSGQDENKMGHINSKVTLRWSLWNFKVSRLPPKNLKSLQLSCCKQGRCRKFDSDLHYVITLYLKWFGFCCRRSSEPDKFSVVILRFRGAKNQKNQFWNWLLTAPNLFQTWRPKNQFGVVNDESDFNNWYFLVWLVWSLFTVVHTWQNIYWNPNNKTTV